ncbi:Golgi 4-transmembrane spanning transporter [Popillia japonica]|uniref:Golgi 4-transmembrane spanning transporter n=1 Tax=Popillia japonica TaxID=7064 RepID=A0AAW1N3K3_POPJA
MRIKINPPRNNELRCCFCLHVRTATILLGIWHLILHILALSVLAIVMRNHQMVDERTQLNDGPIPGNLLPTPLSKIKDDDIPYYLPTTQDGSVYAPDVDMGALMTVCTLAITLLMVYGTVKGKATHLLPFFCLQLFDFTITTLTATGYFCYLRSVHQFVSEHYHNLPYRKELLQMSPQYLFLLLLTIFLASMLWKAYCISIVWRCYKYLTLRQENARSTVHYILRGEVAERAPDPEFLLPDYEAACASFKQPPPPSYQVAVEQPAPPAYPEATAGNPRFGFIITQSLVEPPAGENNNTVMNNVNERNQTAQDDEAGAAAVTTPTTITVDSTVDKTETVANPVETDDETKKDDGLDTLLTKRGPEQPITPPPLDDVKESIDKKEITALKDKKEE